MRHIFILNSFTLKEHLDKVSKRIDDYCKKEKIDYIIESNSPSCDTEDIVRKYKDSESIIIPVGGDGVINRTLNELVGTKNILGFIPYGTGNDFYKSVKRQFEEEYNKCDIVKINNKYFINTACFGIDADVANNKNVVKTKLIPKKQKYNIALVYNFFKYKCRKLEVQCNEELIVDNFTTIAVCNGSYYGSGYNIGPSSNLQDGVLEVYVVKRLNKISMLKLILEMKKGKHEKSKHVKYFKTNKLSIKSPIKFKCNIDGEEVYDENYEIEIIPNGITIYHNENLINSIKRK